MARIPEQRWLDAVITQLSAMSPHLATVVGSLSEPTRRVLLRARTAATERDHLAVDTEHLLLAIMDDGDNAGARALRNLGHDLLHVHNAVIDAMRKAPVPVRAGDGGLSRRAVSALITAWDEMQSLPHESGLNPAHLLLGLWRQGDSVAGRVLAGLGATLEEAREQVILGGNSALEPAEPVSPAGWRGNALTCILADSDLANIDVLVESGAMMTRAEAAAWLIRTGIEKSLALLEQLSATVTELRRLRGSARELIGHHGAMNGRPEANRGMADEDDRSGTQGTY